MERLEVLAGLKTYSCLTAGEKEFDAQSVGTYCYCVTHSIVLREMPFSCMLCDYTSHVRNVVLKSEILSVFVYNIKRSHFPGCSSSTMNQKTIKGKIYYYYCYIIFNHTMVKPYLCRQCDMVLSSNSGFLTHLWTHTGEKSYQCSLCDKAGICTLINDPKRQLWTHTEEKLYQCRHCDEIIYHRIVIICTNLNTKWENGQMLILSLICQYKI